MIPPPQKKEPEGRPGGSGKKPQGFPLASKKKEPEGRPGGSGRGRRARGDPLSAFRIPSSCFFFVCSRPLPLCWAFLLFFNLFFICFLPQPPRFFFCFIFCSSLPSLEVQIGDGAEGPIAGGGRSPLPHWLLLSFPGPAGFP